MIRAAIKGVSANKLRLALTGLAIVIGVAFVAASFVFTDTINARFEALFTDVSAGVDVYVRPVPPEAGIEITNTGSIPEETLDQVLAVPGVRVADGGVAGYAQFVDKEGESIGGQGPPTLGFSWTADEALNPLQIAEGNGRPPTAAGEVVSDVATAESANYALGDTVTVLTIGGPEQFTLVGIANFGSEDNLAGATLAIFELREAQRLFDLEGRLSDIAIAGDEGVDADTLAADIQQALGSDFEVQTAADSNQQQLEEVATALGFLNTALLAFAAVAIFVGAFIIANTFRIIVSQRTRELALLRAIGATGSQIVWMVVLEALVVALVASVIGVLIGLLLAQGLAGLLDAVGANLPQGPLTLRPRTVVIAMSVGLIVTLLAALVPARKAASVPPVAAMHEELARPPRRSLRNRAIAGSLVVLLGLVALMIGLFTNVENQIWLVGIGALVFFLGVSILAPLAARPVASTIGWPLPKLFNATGQLAKENTARQPRRTASTASALMIGVALVVFVAILAASITAQVKDELTENFPADLSASSTNFEVGISPTFTEELAAQPEFDTVTALVFDTALYDGAGVSILAVDPTQIGNVANLQPAPGALQALAGSDGVLVFDAFAEDRSLETGDTVTIGFPKTTDEMVPIVGTFASDDVLLGSAVFILDRPFYDAEYENPFDSLVLATTAPGVSVDDARAVADAVAEPYANVQIQNKDEVVADFEMQINQLLVFFVGLLFLAIIIAILGITNTLSLSIIERTREIGLLRAVGMTRTQTRRMVRWEAVIVALFGAVMGVGIGVFLGWAVVQALGDVGLGAFAVPWTQVVILVVAAGIAGIIAAVYPAWKASRVDVLDAIAYE
jgi:putative ABC transport system permease protein